MRKVSELLGKPVVCLLDGTNEGIIKNITFDKKLRKPLWLLMNDQSEETEYAVNINSIFRCGADAVILKSRNELLHADAAAGLIYNNPINCDIFTSGGKWLGIVKDVNLDENKNEVLSLSLADGTDIGVERIFSSSSNAVVILEEKENLKITPSHKTRSSGRAGAPKAKKPEPITIFEPREEIQPEGQKKLIGDYQFLLGRRTNKDIFNKQNEKIIKKNTLITRDTVEKARAAGKLIDLTVHSLPEQYIY